jgi:hypothetical protein
MKNNRHTILKVYDAPEYYKIRKCGKIDLHLGIYCPGDIVIKSENKQITVTETKRKNNYQTIEIIGITPVNLCHSVHRSDENTEITTITKIKDIEKHSCVCGAYFEDSDFCECNIKTCGLDHIDTNGVPTGWNEIRTICVYERGNGETSPKERLINIDGTWSHIKDCTDVDTDFLEYAYETLYAYNG